MSKWEIYKGREQTFVKHYVLRNYLQSLTYKLALGFRKPEFVLTYIDGFSGPWESVTEDLSDTSFQIAIDELRKAREGLLGHNINLKLRCMFVEKDHTAFCKLKEYTDNIDDLQIKLINGDFEENVSEAVHFAKGNKNKFTFTFIDPTGWTGFRMNNIKPLLELEYSEVMINFMTDFISRFINDGRQCIKDTFTDLFGNEDVQEQWKGLIGRERQAAIVGAYRKRLKEEGNFEYVADTLILNPFKDRTHYNLIYGTRKLEGLLAFREVERKAMVEQGKIRDVAKYRRKTQDTKQNLLFGLEEIATENDLYFTELRTECLATTKNQIIEYLIDQKRIPYEMILVFLENPMVYEKDIKVWLKEWKNNGEILFEGLGPREKVPKKGKNHIIVWKPEKRG